jgi:hypothetical protein
MRTTRSLFGLVGALLPVLFCGGLLLYFQSVRASFGGWIDGGLGRTMFGIAGAGLIFLVIFVIRLCRHLAPPPPPPGNRPTLDAEGSGFDADAALARYLARRDAATPPLFGRKGPRTR